MHQRWNPDIPLEDQTWLTITPEEAWEKKIRIPDPNLEDPTWWMRDGCVLTLPPRDHGQTELFESQTHMWRLKSERLFFPPKLAGQDMFGKTWQPWGRSIPPCGPASVQLYPLPAKKLAGFWKIPRGFDNGSAAPSTNIFFPVSIS